jgi:hypothetical protein
MPVGGLGLSWALIPKSKLMPTIAPVRAKPRGSTSFTTTA